MKLVPCIAWVKRGVPLAVPKKVKLSKEEMQLVMQSATSVLAESGGSSGLGNRPAGDNSEHSDDEENQPTENFDDREEESGGDRASKDLTVLASNDDDYATDQASDDDDEDFQLKRDDNLLLLGRVDDDECELEVHVYNQKEGSFYTHHDYPLLCPPICMESINYSSGADHQGGNLCAIGGLDPVIQLWDLDVVGTMEPVAILGNPDVKRKKQGKKSTGNEASETKTKKRKTICHTDAVLDLAWNRHRPHILASSSADNNVILWDLDTCQGSNILSSHKDKVQAVEWHPVEENILLSGGCDGLVNLWDCRTCTRQRHWTLPDGEVEKAKWTLGDPFRFLVASDVGDLYLFDSRKEEISSESCVKGAHTDAVSGLSFQPTVGDCLATCGVDGVVKIWRIRNDSDKPIELVSKKKLKMGKLFCCSFCPDNPWLLAIGGESGEGVYLWNLRKDEKISTEWNIPRSNTGLKNKEQDDDKKDKKTR